VSSFQPNRFGKGTTDASFRVLKNNVTVNKQNDRRAHIGVKEAMQRKLMSDHKVQRFHVNDDIRSTERQEANMFRRHCMERCTGAKVKRGKWHVP